MDSQAQKPTETVLDFQMVNTPKPSFASAKALTLAALILFPALSIVFRQSPDVDTLTVSSRRELVKRDACTIVRFDTVYPDPGSPDPPQTVPVCAEDLTPTPSHSRVRRLFDIVETDEDAKPTVLHAIQHLHARDGTNSTGETTKSCTVVRYDGYFPYPGSPMEYQPVCAEDQPPTTRKLKRFEMRPIENPSDQYWTPPAHRLKSRSIAEPFAINLTCNPNGTLTKAICAKALAGFKNAGNRIAQALQITTQIKVQAEFVSFCNDGSASTTCGTVDGVTTLGQAGPAANIPVAIGDTQLNVPQALFKNANLQESMGTTVSLNAYDIIAQFNADYNFYFNDNTTAIQATQVDFEFIVMHEFIHGCGFASGWSTWFTSIVGVQGFLTPNYYTYRTSTSTTWGGWNPANVFDKYIVENATQRYLMAGYNSITNFTGSRSQTVSQFVSSFQSSGAPFQEAIRIFSVITSGQFALYFQANPAVSNDSVWLQTYSGSFEQGSSIGHTNDIYSKTSDFLMGAAITGGNLYGQTLDQIIANQGGYQYGAMGPRLISIMASIGWPVVSGALPNSSVSGTTLNTGTTSSNNASTNAAGSSNNLFLGPFTLTQFIGVVAAAFIVSLMGLGLYGYLRKKWKRSRRTPASTGPAMVQTRSSNHRSGIPPSPNRRGVPPPPYPAHPPTAITGQRTPAPRSAAAQDAPITRLTRPSFGSTGPVPHAMPSHHGILAPLSPQEEEEQLQVALALSVSNDR
ncbi:hypothetical protein HDU93_005144 [Gonapodya sp. JEL0774]|nr:hypothetical protein HDU93_005144 [Gonapodya sp. JEL0774]